MISSKQMRAARALLGWKQSDISKAANLSLTAMNAIETETASPRASTILQIQQAYEKQGIEFLSGDGLRMRSEIFNIQTLENEDIIFKLLEDVYETTKRTREPVRWFGVSEDLVVKKYRQAHYAYFTKMKQDGLREYCLCGQKQKQFYAPPSVSDYRILPQEFMSNVDYGVYGIKLCIGNFTKKPRVIVIEHEGIADAYRQQYDTFWKMGQPLKNYQSGFDSDTERLRELKNKTKNRD